MSAAAAQSPHLFCIRTVASAQGCSADDLAHWLQKGGYPVPLNQQIVFTPAAYELLLQFVAQGAACQFNHNTLPVEHDLRRQRNVLLRELHHLNNKRVAQEQTVAYYRRQTLQEKDKSSLKRQLTEIKQELNLVVNEVVGDNDTDWSNASAEYLSLLQKQAALQCEVQKSLVTDSKLLLTKAENALLITMAELQRTTDIRNTLNQQIEILTQRQQETNAAILFTQENPVADHALHKVGSNQLGTAPLVPDFPTVANGEPALSSAACTAEIAWTDVQFDDGALLIRYGSLWLPRYRFPESRRSLNLIKQHYTFRQAPLLQVLLHHHTVLEVLNREVVLYYIHFLSNTGKLLDLPTDIASVNVVKRFARCTKQYYRTNLPNLFRKQSLRFLCEIMDEETSIIPTPELVINSAGSRTVHDSFLFTYKSRFSACIIWESTEEGKATYIFKVGRSTLNHSLQTIFNYIVNDTPNKRSTLIKSPALQRHLDMVAWIPHTTYAEWRRQLRPYYGLTA